MTQDAETQYLHRVTMETNEHFLENSFTYKTWTIELLVGTNLIAVVLVLCRYHIANPYNKPHHS